jgi:hypothetical protein
MSVTGVNSRRYGADHRVVEYGLTEIVRYVQMPEFIQFGEYFVKIGEIKLSNPIQITIWKSYIKVCIVFD